MTTWLPSLLARMSGRGGRGGSAGWLAGCPLGLSPTPPPQSSLLPAALRLGAGPQHPSSRPRRRRRVQVPGPPSSPPEHPRAALQASLQASLPPSCIRPTGPASIPTSPLRCARGTQAPAPTPPSPHRDPVGLSPRGLPGRSTKGGAAAARLRRLLPPPPPPAAAAPPAPSLLPPLSSAGLGRCHWRGEARRAGSAPARAPRPPTPSSVPQQLQLPLGRPRGPRPCTSGTDTP